MGDTLARDATSFGVKRVLKLYILYITDAVIWSILLQSVTFLKRVPLGFSSFSFLISSSYFSFPFLLLLCC